MLFITIHELHSWHVSFDTYLASTTAGVIPILISTRLYLMRMKLN